MCMKIVSKSCVDARNVAICTPYRELLSAYTQALKHPELTGPDKFRSCQLDCVEIGSGQTHVGASHSLTSSFQDLEI